MRVLLAIDSSGLSEVVIREAAARPWPRSARMQIVTVVDTNTITHGIDALAFGTAYIGVEEYVRDQIKSAEILVDSAARRLASAGVEVEVSTAVIEGHPRSRIVEQAEQWGPQLVLIGSRGHTGFTRMLLGSVSRAVLRGAPCSVEIVRATAHNTPGDAGDGMKILLGTDGSECSLAAARSVSARPWPEDTEIKVVSVVDDVVAMTVPGYWQQELFVALLAEKKRLAHEAVEACRKLLSGVGLPVDADVVTGDARTGLLSVAKEWEPDLLVVGSHGRHGVKRLLKGSVSEAVAEHAECSVEVVHESHLGPGNIRP